MRIFSSATKRNSHRNSASNRRVYTVLVVLAVGFLVLTFARGGVGAAASYLFTPAVSVKAWFLESPAMLPTYLRTQAALIAEIQMLEDERAAGADGTLAAQQLKEENERLRELLGLSSHTRLTAGVLMRPGQVPYDTFLIDKGRGDGVLKGATVYVGNTTAIGTVAAVYPHSALVQLVSAPGIQSTAYIFGPDIFTDAVGMGGGVLRVTVPQGVPLAVGDIVVLPVAGSGAYGEVVEVVALESSPQQYGYVTSPAVLQSTRFVQVSTQVESTITFEEARAVLETASSTLFRVDVPNEVLVGTSTASTTIDTNERGR